MSEIKHTSGPWQWDDEVWSDYDPAERAPWLIGADGRSILTGEIRCQTESDARLIAAAPDLLQALQWMLTLHEGTGGEPFGTPDLARAALAKATGA